MLRRFFSFSLIVLVLSATAYSQESDTFPVSESNEVRALRLKYERQIELLIRRIEFLNKENALLSKRLSWDDDPTLEGPRSPASAKYLRLPYRHYPNQFNRR
jgi:hypothetical protein